MAKKKAMSMSADKKADAKMVKSGIGQHESAMHKGKPKTKLKLGK